jgi:hypothetical protein
MATRTSMILTGILQAVLLVMYIVLISSLVMTGSLMPFGGAIIFLMIFCFSALVCGSIVLGYPVYLFTQHRVQDALIVFGSTVASMAVIIIGTIAYIMSMFGG